MSSDTDDMPIDGDRELDAEERKAIRKVLREQAHATWMWKKLRLWGPILSGVVWGIWQGITELSKHWKS